MPPKCKTKKETTPAPSAWLDKFCRAENIPNEVKEILFDQQITSKATLNASKLRFTLPDIPAGSKPPQPVSPVHGDNLSKEGKQSLLPSEMDGKQLKPMQLSYSQFVLGNIKILDSLFLSGNTKEAMEYLTYVKYLSIKGTRFQTGY